MPVRSFEYEKPYLNKLPTYITPPYIDLIRDIDQYGYASVDADSYWIQGLKRFAVKVLLYSDHVKI